MAAISKKKAKKLAEEILRCEMVLRNIETTQEEANQAISKINLIAEAYADNLDAMFMIAAETEKLLFEHLTKEE